MTNTQQTTLVLADVRAKNQTYYDQYKAERDAREAADMAARIARVRSMPDKSGHIIDAVREPALPATQSDHKAVVRRGKGRKERRADESFEAWQTRLAEYRQNDAMRKRLKYQSTMKEAAVAGHANLVASRRVRVPNEGTLRLPVISRDLGPNDRLAYAVGKAVVDAGYSQDYADRVGESLNRDVRRFGGGSSLTGLSDHLREWFTKTSSRSNPLNRIADCPKYDARRDINLQHSARPFGITQSERFVSPDSRASARDLKIADTIADVREWCFESWREKTGNYNIRLAAPYRHKDTPFVASIVPYEPLARSIPAPWALRPGKPVAAPLASK